MASRKRPSEQPSLFVVPPAPSPRLEYESPVVSERALSVVPSPVPVPESEVIVEALDDGRFVVSLLRHHGTTVAAVRYTRRQLEMLIQRGITALGIG